jgi:hypothetical protein
VDFDQQVSRARDVLRIRVGIDVKAPVVIRSLKPDERSNGVTADPYGLFDRQRGIVFIDPNACRQYVFPQMGSVEECSQAVLVLALHEVLHAWQSTMIESRQGRIPDDRWLRFVCEGHAIEYSERLAIASGVAQDVIAKFHVSDGAIPSKGLDVQRAELLHYFDYVLSRQYVSLISENVADFTSLLERDLSFASVLAAVAKDSGKSPVPTTHAVAATTRPALRECPKTIAGFSVSTNRDLDFLDCMAYVAPDLFRELPIAAAFGRSGLINGRNADGKMCEMVWLLMADEQSARAVWKSACRNHESLARGPSGVYQTDELPRGELWVGCEWISPKRFMLIHRYDNMLLLVNTPDPMLAYGIISEVEKLLYTERSK